jgi:tripartite-type tricarboxylate transporter receptor subunit TctC
MPGMENIPTFGELGYPLPVRIIFGIAGPANLPQNVVQTWTNTLRKISASPDWTTLLGRYMALPSLVLGDDFRKQMVDDYQRLGKILPGLKIEH